MGKIINNNPKGYAELRNITGKNPQDFIHVKDFFVKMLSLRYKLLKKSYSPFFKGLFYYPFDTKTKCIFFNSINLGKNPWEVIFESTLPRLGNAPKWLYDIGVKRLAKENCQKIIAISRCAYDNQVNYLNDFYPSYAKQIIAKMSVKLPPQKILVKNMQEKNLSKDKIVFTLIGGDFFRKGGGEVLQVFDELIPKYPKLHLNIISDLKYGDYATHTVKQDQEVALELIKKNKSSISHYTKLKNDDVLELLKKTNVGLLPTWADSFGYSVLEAQAAGCPVISTDIRALPEVNNEEKGWMINLPKDDQKNAITQTKESRAIIGEIIKNELKLIICSILDKPEIIAIKGNKCLNEIFTKHNY